MMSSSELLQLLAAHRALLTLTFLHKHHRASLTGFQVERECEELDLNSQGTNWGGERLAVILQKIREDMNTNGFPLC